MRRGKLTVHRAFDEATAVLAGDALLAIAFEILSSSDTHPNPQIRTELTGELARAAGAYGMAGGQMLDLLPLADTIDLEAIIRLQRLRPRLDNWSLKLRDPRYCAPYEDPLRGYAHCLGAFQIADDLLDHDGDEATVGKRLRKDSAQGKQNFVTVLGAQRARRQAELLVEQSIEHLRDFGQKADLLMAVAHFAIDRDR